MRIFVSLVFMAVSAAPALAQAPTSYVIRIYQGTSTVPAQSFTVTAQQVSCNQLQPTVKAPPVENPIMVVWNDYVNAGQACLYVNPQIFEALADGSYEGTISAATDSEESPESARVPFSRRRPNPPAVPTGVRFTRSLL